MSDTQYYQMKYLSDKCERCGFTRGLHAAVNKTGTQSRWPQVCEGFVEQELPQAVTR